MGGKKLSPYARLLRDLSDAELASEIERPDRLRLESGLVGNKRIDIAYWPHPRVNVDAQIAIVGLTPGRQQMRNAWMEVRRCLRDGYSEADAFEAARTFASFSGPMRDNLVEMLDKIRANELLGLESTASLWNSDAHLVQFTSVLNRPVFVNGDNYSGNPPILSTPLLREQLRSGFASVATTLRDAIFVPLGSAVSPAIEFAAKEDRIDLTRILAGMPHPSGANAERVAFFVGRKRREHLSPKVDADRLIAARRTLKAKIKKLLVEQRQS
ncbi:hypothetical protein [Mycolicibacterium sp. 120270]|uniref:hypothetical protein n=1 Tax=Mycolicibacterium sp. 120270 TaxID=3090600 RepID=UPI00299EEDA0|nr:hypothetical protein [Mycolicibacterium sp. 120270]MDX1883230.1 hypothetical protein [Mycolicibacterium sp. 120270]